MASQSQRGSHPVSQPTAPPFTFRQHLFQRVGQTYHAVKALFQTTKTPTGPITTDHLYDIKCGNRPIDLADQRLRLSTAFGSYFTNLLEQEQGYTMKYGLVGSVMGTMIKPKWNKGVQEFLAGLKAYSEAQPKQASKAQGTLQH